MTDVVRIADVLGGTRSAGEQVTVQGWVRTRRDSKAGLSFVQVHDGSSFAPLQVVAKNELPNYEEEIQHLTAGCAITATGMLAESQGKGQSVELQAESVTVVGWVDDPDSYPVAAKRHTFEYLREVPHLRVRTNTIGAVARVRNALAQAIHRYFHEHGFYWIHTPIITASRRRGRRRDVPRLDPRHGQPAAYAGRRRGLQPGLLRPADLPHGLGPAQRGDLLPGHDPGLHLRADLPGRELQHQPAPVRVLDGGAGDRLRRPLGQRRPGRVAAEVRLPSRAR